VTLTNKEIYGRSALTYQPINTMVDMNFSTFNHRSLKPRKLIGQFFLLGKKAKDDTNAEKRCSYVDHYDRVYYMTTY